MDKISIVDQIQSNSNLLSMPQVLLELLEETCKEDFTADALANIVLKDPSLTSKILQLSNSSFYARLSEIKTVHQAVAVLGLTTVKCLALSTTVFRPDQIGAKAGVDTAEFFSYVLSVSSAAEQLAVGCEYDSPEEALIAGLLHDIGIVYFLHRYPSEYHRVLDLQVEGMSLIEAERKVFGIDHCDLGSRLGASWNLPESITTAIAGHHNTDHSNNSDTVLVNITRLAVLLTLDRFSDHDRDLEDRLAKIEKISSLLGMERSQIDEVTRNMLSGMLEKAESMGVDVGNVEELLAKANREIWKSYLTVEHLFKERQELSQKLLLEEREKGAMAAKNIALSTLSHYLNNSVMAISGRAQIMEMLQKQGKIDQLIEQVPDSVNVINTAVRKVVAVMEEMKDISPIDKVEFFKMSKAMNIDDRIEKRMATMEENLIAAPLVE